MFIFATSIQNCTRGSSQGSWTRKKKKKRHPDWKGNLKLPLFIDDMIMYIENSKVPTRFLEWINKSKKVARYKIIHKNQLLLLYAINKQSKIEENNSVYIGVTKNNILGNKFVKRSVKCILKNYKTLLRKTEDLNK